ncbi:Hint domain-containing protein [Acetobacter cibinongensis]|nr:Hint domain-containing protein [Acetobacter cibinongensis]
MEVRSGGYASGGSILNGQTTVSAGASAASVRVGSKGYLLDQGGVVSGITVSSDGTLGLASGATAYNAVLGVSAGLNVDGAGTVAYNTTQSGAWGIVTSGAALSGGSITSAQTTISAGASATGVTLNSGGYLLDQGGVVSGIAVSANGTLGLASGAQAYNTVLTTSGGINVAGTGTVLNNTTQSGGFVSAHDGGEVLSGKVQDGWTAIGSGGVASAVTAQGGGILISAGGSGNALNIASAGYDVVYAGGVTQATSVGAGGVEHVEGGVASDTILANGANQYVTNGGKTVAVSIQNGASQTVGTVSAKYWPDDTPWSTSGSSFAGGDAVATSTTVGAGGALTVTDGGKVVSAAVQASGKAVVESGGQASNTTVNGNLYVSGGAQVTSTIVGSGGNEYVQAGATVSNTLVQASGQEVVGSNGLALNTVVSGAGAHIWMNDGGVTSGAILSAGGTQGVGAGNAVGTIVGSGGGLTVVSNQVAGSAVSAVINNGGSATIYGGGVVSNTTVNDGGTLTVSQSATVADTTVNNGGSAVVKTGAGIGDLTVMSGGSATISPGGVLSGTMTLSNGGHATINNSAGGTVVMDGSTNTGLIVTGLENGGTLNTLIAGFDGVKAGNSDGIEIAGVKASDVKTDGISYPNNDQVVLTLTSGKTITLNIKGVQSYGFTLSTATDGSGDVVFEVCFLSGSMISTPSGEVAVEDLLIGDHVTTWDWQQQRKVVKSVVWTGRKHMEVKTDLADVDAGYPVRVKAGAIADGVPYKDLLITPEHSLFFEDKFVPVRMLVNGRSIFYDRSITSYDYFHIEVEEHAVIRADGMLTESYLDTGNRSTFRQDGTVVRFGQKQAERNWETDGAAALVVTRGTVEPLFRTLEARSTEIGFEQTIEAPALTSEADLHLVTETGEVIRALRHQGNVATFMLPAGVETVHLVSRSSRPSDVIGPFVDDRRSLGVLVGQVSLFDGNVSKAFDTHLTQDDLSGWYGLEASCRWTNGSAALPLGKIDENGLRLLSVQILASGPYLLAADKEDGKGLVINSKRFFGL